jgi:hypothetical protein
MIQRVSTLENLLMRSNVAEVTSTRRPQQGMDSLMISDFGSNSAHLMNAPWQSPGDSQYYTEPTILSTGISHTQQTINNYNALRSPTPTTAKQKLTLGSNIGGIERWAASPCNSYNSSPKKTVHISHINETPSICSSPGGLGGYLKSNNKGSPLSSMDHEVASKAVQSRGSSNSRYERKGTPTRHTNA